MATSLRPLHAALFAKLSAALSGQIFAKVTESAAFPYASFGPTLELPDDSHDAQGLNATVTLHFWDKAESNAGVFDMFATADSVLDRMPLAIAGFKDVQIKHTQHQTIADPDPTIRHLEAQYRIHMTKE